ncbi:hypothetical protein [Kallotenue papyrolyticum]|uniref:hypothetical protein n=1 Tax=Kallotenue papyrolyticum TaxID=1325125 RepID=UPI00047854AF|nr:hypothetical protein [Kallotenue papyrolyticum]
MSDAGETALRPADLARLLLASGDLLPRQRARDQQADLAGIALKRAALEQLIALDPEPEDLDAALEQIIAAMGPPYGPIRGICLNIRYDWEAASTTPGFVEWLLQEALRTTAGQRRKGNRADPEAV